MKPGQLIECNMKNRFLEKSYTKCGGETSHRSFYEKVKLSISLDQSFIQFVFIVWQLESHKNILKLSWRPLAFSSY